MKVYYCTQVKASIPRKEMKRSYSIFFAHSQFEILVILRNLYFSISLKRLGSGVSNRNENRSNVCTHKTRSISKSFTYLYILSRNVFINNKGKPTTIRSACCRNLLLRQLGSKNRKFRRRF